MRCPLCNRMETGRVASEQYFCWRCCVEFHGGPGHWEVFRVDEEGNLVQAEDLMPRPSAVDASGSEAATLLPAEAAV